MLLVLTLLFMWLFTWTYMCVGMYFEVHVLWVLWGNGTAFGTQPLLTDSTYTSWAFACRYPDPSSSVLPKCNPVFTVVAFVQSHTGRLASSLSKGGECDALETMEDHLPTSRLTSHVDLYAELSYKGAQSSLQVSQTKYMQKNGNEKRALFPRELWYVKLHIVGPFVPCVCRHHLNITYDKQKHAQSWGRQSRHYWRSQAFHGV